MMSKVRPSENKADVALRSRLWRRGLRYRLYRPDLPGRPDLVFAARRAIVFVDGDFWHGRGIRENGRDAFAATMRTARRDWWIRKLERTITRDDQVTAALQDAGWRVLRVWESDVLRDPDAVAAAAECFVRDT